MEKFRTEQDSIGEVKVPADALYGAQTQRARDNFALEQRPLPIDFVRKLALIKAAAAHANCGAGVLDTAVANAIADAAQAVAEGAHDDQFPLSLFQTGSGTSTNMNMNEVLANLAGTALGHAVHANDEVNCSQSSNDVIPSCLQLTALAALQNELLPGLHQLVQVLRDRSDELSSVVKTGRTHLMDAMPVTLGQELGTWAFQLDESRQRIEQVLPRLRQLPIGGSAVGTGVNVPPGFADQLVDRLGELTQLKLQICPNSFSRMAGQDVALECSAALRGLAIVFTKICNDLRWMSSGPLSGLSEITLEALQPGSSIMPGKINPVLPEAVLMVCADVTGNDASVAQCAASGNFQLNVMLPLIADKLSSSCSGLTWSCTACARTVAGFTVEHERIERSLAANPILVTALNTHIGYEAAAAIAKRSYREQRSVLDVAVQETNLSRAELEELLNPLRLTGQTEGV